MSMPVCRLANGLLLHVVKGKSQHHIEREAHLQFTIESRELTPLEFVRREARSTVIEAADRDAALSEFARRNASQVVSFSTPAAGRESIATMKKDASVYLVRVYEA
jgi:hypothetical protein